MTGQERVLTVLGVVALVGIIGGAAALALGGGGDEGRAVRSTSATTTLASTSTTAPSPATTTAPTAGGGGGQTTVTVGIICASAEEASTTFVNGWIANDQAAAKRCGSDAAVATIFANNGAGAQYTFQGCDYTDPGVPICSYSYEGGAAQFTVEGTEAAGWKVTKVGYIAD
jgi:hypothetical protein